MNNYFCIQFITVYPGPAVDRLHRRMMHPIIGPAKIRQDKIRTEADFQESTVKGLRGAIDGPKLSPRVPQVARLLIFRDPFLINVHSYIDPILCTSRRWWAENMLNVASHSLLKIVKVELCFKTGNKTIGVPIPDHTTSRQSYLWCSMRKLG